MISHLPEPVSQRPGAFLELGYPQATQAAAARKSEIEWRAELDVKSHEVGPGSEHVRDESTDGRLFAVLPSKWSVPKMEMKFRASKPGRFTASRGP